MTALDTAGAVLAKASLYDPTFSRPDPSIAVAWADVLGNVSRDDALNVVATHYATETRRLMPADVIAGVKRIRRARLDAYGSITPDTDTDNPFEYRRLMREKIEAVADGRITRRDDRLSIEGRNRVEREIIATAGMLPADIARNAFQQAQQEARARRKAEEAKRDEAKAQRRLAIEAAADELTGDAS